MQSVTGGNRTVRDQSKRIALLSIRPGLAQAIMEGEKGVEFRKGMFAHEVSHIVVYAKIPIGKVAGYFEVSYIDRDSPTELWARYEAVAGVTHKEFQRYYKNKTQGVAIVVGKFYALPHPVPLTTLGEDLTPPQNYRYLAHEAFEILRNLAPGDV